MCNVALLWLSQFWPDKLRRLWVYKDLEEGLVVRGGKIRKEERGNIWLEHSKYSNINYYSLLLLSVTSISRNRH